MSSVGEGISAFRDALFHGRSCFTRSLAYPILSFPVLGAYITNFSFSRALERFPTLEKQRKQTLEKIARSLPQSMQIAMISALETWQSAHIDSAYEASRIGLVVQRKIQQHITNTTYITPFNNSPTFLHRGMPCILWILIM